MTWARELTLHELSQGGLFSDGDWIESKHQDPMGPVRLTQLADIGVGEFRSRSDRWMRRDQATALGCTFLAPDDILIARMPDPIGRACLAPSTIGDAVTAVDVAILRLRRADLNPKYVMWAINSPQFYARVADLQSGTTRKRISRKNLASLSIPVPPLAVQQRTVGLLEHHLSRLDAAVRMTERVGRRLETLNGVLLGAMSKGEEVPLAELSVSAGYGTSEKCLVSGPGPAVVRIPNLVDGHVDLTDEKRVANPLADVTKTMLKAGDLLIIRTNGSVELIGRSAVVQAGVEAAFASYLIRYRVDTSRVRPEWIQAMLSTPGLRARIESLAASSAGQHNLSLGKLNPLPIPVPSLAEQDTLLARLKELRLGFARARLAAQDAERRTQALRRSILAAAFSGRLLSHGEA